jgi:hypothetical protein
VSRQNGTENDASFSSENAALQRTESAVTYAKSGLAIGSAVVAPASPGLALTMLGVSESLGFILSKINEKKIQNVVKAFEQIQEKTNLSERELEEKASEPEYTPLFKDGLLQASNTSTTERLDAVTHILSGGLKSRRQAVIAKKCLRTLNQLDDIEFSLFFELTQPDFTDAIFQINNEEYQAIKSHIVGDYGIDEYDESHATYMDDVVDECLQTLFRLELFEQEATAKLSMAHDGASTTYRPTAYGMILAAYIRGQFQDSNSDE